MIRWIDARLRGGRSVGRVRASRSLIVTGGCGFIGSDIVHYAAESCGDNSIADPEPFLRTDGGGVSLLLEAVRRYGRLGARIVRGSVNCRRF